MPKTKAAGFIIYKKDNQEIEYLLLQFRSRIYWKHPSGRIDGSEEEMATALRELEEETGLKKEDIIIDQKFKENINFIFKAESEKGKIETVYKNTVFFLAESKKEKIIISGEHLDWGWFKFKEALKLGHFKTQKDLLQKVHSYLLKK